MSARFPDPSARSLCLRSELANILERIVDADTDRVILFGSLARGCVRSTSDIDLLVIRRDVRRPAERVDDLYRRARARVALDLLVYTPEELQRARAESSFLRSALRDGEVLYERGGALD